MAFKRYRSLEHVRGQWTNRPYRVVEYRKEERVWGVSGYESFFTYEAMCDDGSWDECGRDYESAAEAYLAIEKCDDAAHMEMMEIKNNVQ